MDTQEASVFTAILISGSVIGLIIIYFFISIVKEQRRNLALSKLNMLTEVTAMEKERARIANDLHDDISPVLSVVRFQINSIVVANPDDALQVKQASEHLDNLIDRIRAISNNLMPASLLRKGLITSLSDFISNLQEATGIKISFTFSELPPLSEEKNINIYRIIQETMHNCIKHAQASDISLSITATPVNLSILLTDNGVGFDYETSLKNSTGLGLRSLKNRTELMDGTLRVESNPGKGTAFLFEIPIA